MGGGRDPRRAGGRGDARAGRGLAGPAAAVRRHGATRQGNEPLTPNLGPTWIGAIAAITESEMPVEVRADTRLPRRDRRRASGSSSSRSRSRSCTGG